MRRCTRGITTLANVFKQMGKTLFKLINIKKIQNMENSWKLNLGKSI